MTTKTNELIIIRNIQESPLSIHVVKPFGRVTSLGNDEQLFAIKNGETEVLTASSQELNELAMTLESLDKNFRHAICRSGSAVFGEDLTIAELSYNITLGQELHTVHAKAKYIANNMDFSGIPYEDNEIFYKYMPHLQIDIKRNGKTLFSFSGSGDISGNFREAWAVVCNAYVAGEAEIFASRRASGRGTPADDIPF